ncbi:MAG: sugar ABC transporter ATP-binding protein, partial [Treponema sp.]|nr:sugar ABC transporter ATP-binding protein [Treponema sp.]
PTRGIDVGARAEIESRIQELVKKGISVLMISSELEELINNCSRVEVLKDGILAGELKGDEVSEKNVIGIIAQATGK